MRMAAWVAAAAMLAVPAAALAHVTVWPRQSAEGAREKYMVRAPNEKAVATVRVEAAFPPGLRVTGFQQTPGWTIEARRDGSGAIVGASWSGSLPPDQFVEFGVAAINPASGGAMTWRFVQTYADGTRVEWTGAPGSATPAPQVELRPAAPAAGHQH